jgi:hypothetical protein
MATLRLPDVWVMMVLGFAGGGLYGSLRRNTTRILNGGLTHQPLSALQRPPWRSFVLVLSVVTARGANSGLPSRAFIRRYRIDLRAVPWINRIIGRSVAPVRCAWRKAFIVTTPAVHPPIGLIPDLTAILTAILPGTETVLWAPIVLRIEGGCSRECEQQGSCNPELSHHTTPQCSCPNPTHVGTARA